MSREDPGDAKSFELDADASLPFGTNSAGERQNSNTKRYLRRIVRIRMHVLTSRAM
jgi:hypothetical protein